MTSVYKKVIGLLVVVLLALTAFAVMPRADAAQENCNSSQIIRCGVKTKSQLMNKLNGSSELRGVFSHYGLSKSNYSEFKSEAREGVVYRDGRVVVDGQVVATNANTVGRKHWYSGDKSVKINGKTYYKNTTQKRFASYKSFKAWVWFTNKGTVKFITLKECGNPAWGKNIKPSYSCDKLNKRTVSGKPDTYQFWTNTTAKNNASIAKVVYNFGDGTKITKKNPREKVTHTYTKAGNFTAKVTVYVNLPGKNKTTVVSAACATTIKVTAPFQKCVSLSAKVITSKENTYQFTATTRQGGGSVLKNAVFNFGDGEKQTVAKTSKSSVVATHTYDKAGSYKITAKVNFNTKKGAASVNCVTKVVIAPEMCPIKPNVPKDSPECEPCPYNPELPKDSPACEEPEVPEEPEEPEELPKTGAGGVLGLFAGVTVTGGAAHNIVRRLRKS